MNAKEFVKLVASMTTEEEAPDSDHFVDDCIETLDRLIREARAIIDSE